MTSAIKLGVNIDHIATIRQARGTKYPDPVQAGFVAIDAGADLITVHLREDRRHVNERDVKLLKDCLTVPLNLEMAATPEMLEFALQLCPEKCCLVPEKRAELTTEGGLDVCAFEKALAPICAKLANQGVEVSLFIDPDPKQITAAAKLKVPVIELHTGAYAEASDEISQNGELEKLYSAARQATTLGLQVNAGHGLTYQNVTNVAGIAELAELNIGHSIVARALFHGLASAVSEMKQLITQVTR